MCILITGATSGIGRALTFELAASGHQLVVTGRSEQKLNQLAAEVQSRFPELTMTAVAADLESEAQTSRLAQEVHNQISGPLRAIVHCAGVGEPAFNLHDWQMQDLESALRVNVLVPFQLTHALLPILWCAKKPARVMLLGAGMDRNVQPGTGSYGISKMALRRLFDQWYVEFDKMPGAPLISLFQPGVVDTPGLRAHLASAFELQLPHSHRLSDRLTSGQALTGEQAASAIAYALNEVPDMDYHGSEFKGRDLVDSLSFSGS